MSMLSTPRSIQPFNHCLPPSLRLRLTQDEFCHDAAHTPHVQGCAVHGVPQQPLNGAVPQRHHLGGGGSRSGWVGGTWPARNINTQGIFHRLQSVTRAIQVIPPSLPQTARHICLKQCRPHPAMHPSLPPSGQHCSPLPLTMGV